MLLTPKEIALAAAQGAVALIDPARLSSRWSRVYRASAAVFTGGVTAYALKDEELGLPVAGQAAVGVGVGGVMYATMGIWERMDAGTMVWLRRSGMRHPRVVLAVATTALALGMTLLEKRDDAEPQGARGGSVPAGNPEPQPAA